MCCPSITIGGLHTGIKTMEEIWKDVVGYEGLYEVSNAGKVRNKNKELTQNVSNKGYLYATLCKDRHCVGKRVHRLVAQAFIPNLENKPEVNHKNNVRTDNRAENLEWMTHTENVKHTVKAGRHSKGEMVCFSKLDPEKVIFIRKSTLSYKELGKMFGITANTIYAVKKWITWKHVH